MPSDEKESTEYLIALPPELSERLNRAAGSRAPLDNTLGVNDIILEAVHEHLTASLLSPPHAIVE
ncbi:hypothetical protein [Phyllobacterium zundukense]|uniref:Uncharacterized protein n=1 Tax=Phyllobacterium zundukense TaxID=1867719 RepID=A0A2N9W562_9HYPH|nr:hypothetical protein [Phyllobacterium zundukense]ATU94262.1 hypothetical protein BLM14_21105 [Phyllobacterium zundukense]PIO46880.1 hypothetical protein B5P45_00060 [Phyllobacterium zundukense]